MEWMLHSMLRPLVERGHQVEVWLSHPRADRHELRDRRSSDTEALSRIIEAKREHREPPKLQEPEAAPGQIVYLMAALTESAQKARASRGEDADVHELPKKKAAKKEPAEEAAAKRTTKKAAAKKTSGRRPRSA